MNKIEIRVDKRTELMSVLLYISNYRKEYPSLLVFDKNVLYVKDVFETFSKFSSHKVVELLNKIIANLKFSYDVPYALAWQLKDDFSVNKLLSNPFKEKLNSAQIVVDFMNEIKNFAKQSNFEEFYNNHLCYYNDLINKAESKINFNIISHFEEFYKEKTNQKYILNLLPLCSRYGAFYDYYHNNLFIDNITNDKSGDFIQISKPINKHLFKIFTLCKLNKMIEKNLYKIPKAEEFVNKKRNQFMTISNTTFICEEIAAVLNIVFEEIFLKMKQADIKTELDKCKTKCGSCVYQIYDILKEWQNSENLLEKYIQRILDCFKRSDINEN